MILHVQIRCIMHVLISRFLPLFFFKKEKKKKRKIRNEESYKHQVVVKNLY
jgi:hypothetical protein